MSTASSRFNLCRNACWRKSDEVSTRTFCPPCSIRIETRRRLSEKTSDLKGSFNDMVDSAADNLKSAKNKVNEFVRKGEKTVEDLRNEKGTEQWTS